ncbi:transglycosylase SLT domain-containing protein [Streptomyces anandii]|uniref:transglycosylase SLT domain-containing protein n=1 Tax=Streptomyces anandii TaxID=285454 RepID=UPI0036938426
MDELNNIRAKGQFDVAPKLNPVKPKSISLNMPTLPGGIGGAVGGGGTGNVSLDKLIKAIRQQESGGNYSAVNKDSGAAGGYQIMPYNIGPWSLAALGRTVSYNEFMRSPAVQDAIASFKLGQYLRKYGAAGAAVAWYGGEGSVKNMYSKTTQTGGYPSLYAYWTSVLNKM